MKIVLASTKALNVPEAYLQAEDASVARVEAAQPELPGRVARLTPDLVLLHADDEALPALVTAFRTTCPRAVVVPYCPAPSSSLLLELLRLGVPDVLTTLGEGTPERLSGFLRDAAALQRATPAPKARKIGFLAGKGGSGTTFLLANFAHVLAGATQGRVLVIDLGLPFGDLDLHLVPDRAKHDLADFGESIDRLDRALVGAMIHHVSDNLDIIPAPVEPGRMVQLNSERVLALIRILEPFYTYILFDLGSSLNHIGIAACETLEQLAIVSRLEIPGARRTGQLLKLLTEIDFPQDRIQIIANETFGKGALPVDAFENAIGHAVNARLPDATAVAVTAMAQSVPAASLAPHSPLAKVVTQCVSTMTGEQVKGKSRWAFFGNS